MMKINRYGATLWTLCLFTIASSFPLPSFAKAPEPRTSLHQVRLNGDQFGEIGISLGPTGGKVSVFRRGDDDRSTPVVQSSVIAHVDSVHLYGGRKLVIVGSIDGHAQSEVLIFDLTSSTLTDRFLAIKPAISPDGRFIAYSRFFQTHFVEGVEFQYRIYDLLKSNAENRPRVEPRHHIVTELTPPDPGEVAFNDIGIPILSDLGPDGLPRENVLLELKDNPHHLQSDFVWSEDSRRLAYVDGTPRDGWSLVVVRLSTGIRAVRFPLEGTDSTCDVGKKRCKVVMSGAFRIAFSPGGVELVISDSSFPMGYRKVFSTN